MTDGNCRFRNIKTWFLKPDFSSLRVLYIMYVCSCCVACVLTIQRLPDTEKSLAQRSCLRSAKLLFRSTKLHPDRWFGKQQFSNTVFAKYKASENKFYINLHLFGSVQFKFKGRCKIYGVPWPGFGIITLRKKVLAPLFYYEKKY